jgi:hypothetical protein
MILSMPTDPTAAKRLQDARDAFETASQNLAEAEQAEAARLIRVLGTGATTALFCRYFHDSDDSYDFDLLVVLDAAGEPLWFNSRTYRYDCTTYPGAEVISDDHARPVTEIDEDVQYKVEDHIERAYDAADGTYAALDGAADAHFDSTLHLLSLDITAALEGR